MSTEKALTSKKDTLSELRILHEEICTSDGGESEMMAHERRGANEIERLRAALKRWESNCTGRHGSQAPCVSGDSSAPERQHPTGPFSVAELRTILDHEAYSDREKQLAGQMLGVLDQLLRHSAPETKALRESDWHCVHCGRDNDPSESHCVQCEWSRRHTIAGVLHERGCFDHPCICGAQTGAQEPPLRSIRPNVLQHVTSEWGTTKNDTEVTTHHRMVEGVLCRWWGDGPTPAGVVLIDRAVSLMQSPDETPARHTLDCDMVTHPNCTRCNCGSSVDPNYPERQRQSPQASVPAGGVPAGPAAPGSAQETSTSECGTPQGEAGDRAGPRVSPLDRKVTVCASCLCSSCWQGEFCCENHKTATTVEKTIRELWSLGNIREDSGYWFKDVNTGKVDYDAKSAAHHAWLAEQSGTVNGKGDGA